MQTRFGWLVPALLVLALPTACSREPVDGVPTAGGGQPGNQADASKAPDDPQERVRQFVACMRAQGVDLPDPEPGDTTGKSALQFNDGNLDKKTYGPAMEKCSHLLPNGGQPQRLSPEQLERSRRFTQCMRENGVPNFPDPDEMGVYKDSTAGEVNKNDPVVLAAIEKCRAVR